LLLCLRVPEYRSAVSGCRRFSGLPDVAADQRGQFFRLVQHVERGEMVPPAGVVAAVLAGPEQDAGIGAGRRLAGLHIEPIGMQCDFTADGDAAGVGAQIEFTGGEAERVGEF
jgi:hypothetical protein